MPNVLKSGSLNLLEPSGPVQACNGIALPFTFKGTKNGNGIFVYALQCSRAFTGPTVTRFAVDKDLCVQVPRAEFHPNLSETCESQVQSHLGL